MIKLVIVLGALVFMAGLFVAVYLGARHLPLAQQTVTVNTTLPVRTITAP